MLVVPALQRYREPLTRQRELAETGYFSMIRQDISVVPVIGVVALAGFLYLVEA